MTDRATKTVGSLLFRGIDAVEATCHSCNHAWQTPIDILPSATTLETVAGLLVCADCGGREIGVTIDASPGVMN